MELKGLLRICLLQYWLRPPFLLCRLQHYLLRINRWYRRYIWLNQARVNIRRAYPHLMVSLPRQGFIIPVLIRLFNYGLHPFLYTRYDRTPQELLLPDKFVMTFGILVGILYFFYFRPLYYIVLILRWCERLDGDCFGRGLLWKSMILWWVYRWTIGLLRMVGLK